MSKILVLSLLFVMSTTHASVLKLADVLVSSVALKSKLYKEGVNGASVNRLKSFIDTSVHTLTAGTDGNLYNAVKSIPVNGVDIAKKRALLKKLRQGAESVKNDDFVDTVNDLIYLADRYGISSANTLSCSVCVSDQLSILGYKTSIRKIGQKELVKHLRRIPKSSRSLLLYNKKRAKNLNVVDSFKYLNENELKTMAFFQEIAFRGKGEYKKLAQSILAFNKAKDGKVYLAGPKANSKLWKVFSTNLSEEKATKMNKVIRKSLNTKDPKKRVSQFYRELEEMAVGDIEKAKRVSFLKKRNCFFK